MVIFNAKVRCARAVLSAKVARAGLVARTPHTHSRSPLSPPYYSLTHSFSSPPHHSLSHSLHHRTANILSRTVAADRSLARRAGAREPPTLRPPPSHLQILVRTIKTQNIVAMYFFFLYLCNEYYYKRKNKDRLDVPMPICTVRQLGRRPGRGYNLEEKTRTNTPLWVYQDNIIFRWNDVHLRSIISKRCFGILGNNNIML